MTPSILCSSLSTSLRTPKQRPHPSQSRARPGPVRPTRGYSARDHRIPVHHTCSSSAKSGWVSRQPRTRRMPTRHSWRWRRPFPPTTGGRRSWNSPRARNVRPWYDWLSACIAWRACNGCVTAYEQPASARSDLTPAPQVVDAFGSRETAEVPLADQPVHVETLRRAYGKTTAPVKAETVVDSSACGPAAPAHIPLKRTREVIEIEQENAWTSGYHFMQPVGLGSPPRDDK